MKLQRDANYCFCMSNEYPLSLSTPSSLFGPLLLFTWHPPTALPFSASCS